MSSVETIAQTGSDISKWTGQRDGGSAADENSRDVTSGESSDDRGARKCWRFWVAFFVLILCTFLSSIDATILATALPPITKELNGTTILAFWCATSFLLAKTVVQPIWGNISEIFGRKYTLLAIIIIFLIGSILCARSVSMVMLVASRALQGVGGGGLITLVEVTITDLVPLAERGTYLGIVGLIWALGTVIAPIIGGACAGAGQWRWIFYLNIPICALCFVGVALFLSLRKTQNSFSQKVRRIDWIGVLVFMASITSLLFGITVGGTVYEWTSFRTLVPIILGVVGLIAFGIIEAFVSKDPMMPLKVFASRTALSAYLGIFLHGLTMWNLTIYLVFWFQSVRVRTPLGAAIDSLPLIISTTLSSAVSGFVVTKFGRLKLIVSFGWLLATIGTGLMCILSPSSNMSQQIGIQILEGCGMGTLFTTLQLEAQVPQLQRDVGIAAAVFTFIRSFGQTVGVAIGGVIFQNEFNKRIAEQIGNLGPEYLISGSDATGFVGLLSSAPEAVRIVLQYVYAESLRVIWYVMVPFAGLGLFTSFFARDLVLERKHDVAQRFEAKNEKDDVVA